MVQTLRTLIKKEKEKYRVPRRVQDVIPVQRIWNDGIFKTGKQYSKTYMFADINYETASDEDKESMYLKYAELLNSFDSEAVTKITINNKKLTKDDFERIVKLPLSGDDLDELREDFNNHFRSNMDKADCILQEKYITVSVFKQNVDEARMYFNRFYSNINRHFRALGSKCVELDASERLRILHDFYRPSEEDFFHFDVRDMAKKGHDFKDYICPDSMEKHSDYFRMGNKYGRVLFLKDYATNIRDDIIQAFTEISRDAMFSIDVIPVPTDEAIREVQNKLLGIETNITNWQRRQNNNNNFSATIPYDMKLQQTELTEFLNDLSTRDQRMMFAVMTMVVTADTKEQLDIDTESIQAKARERMCQMAPLRYQQFDGLNTVLPIGARKINAFRTLTTESLAVFIPFKVQEIMERGGIYLGENAISHNLIICNRENLMNQSMVIMGVPGSGKSFIGKLIKLQVLLNTEDHVITCDPEGEHVHIDRLLGDETTVIRLTPGGPDKLNIMYMEDGYGENNPVIMKSQFIMSLIEQIDKGSVGPQHKSIIDRCTELVYRDAKASGTVPTLSTFRDKLLQQPEEIAKDIALSLELYTEGSLDIFGKESNVDLNKRVVTFDIHSLGEQLKPAGLLVITDTILNRVTQNWKKGIRTHVFIDEFHVLFDNEYSASFFTSAWRQFRKRNAYPCAITQNVEYLLDSVQARTLLSNSEFIIMLNQAASDRAELARLLNISNEQLGYITDADAGCGLIRYGSALVPFINKYPKDTQIYKLLTTRPGEGVFSGQV